MFAFVENELSSEISNLFTPELSVAAVSQKCMANNSNISHSSVIDSPHRHYISEEEHMSFLACQLSTAIAAMDSLIEWNELSFNAQEKNKCFTASSADLSCQSPSSVLKGADELYRKVGMERLEILAIKIAEVVQVGLEGIIPEALQFLADKQEVCNKLIDEDNTKCLEKKAECFNWYDVILQLVVEWLERWHGDVFLSLLSECCPSAMISDPHLFLVSCVSVSSSANPHRPYIRSDLSRIHYSPSLVQYQTLIRCSMAVVRTMIEKIPSLFLNYAENRERSRTRSNDGLLSPTTLFTRITPLLMAIYASSLNALAASFTDLSKIYIDNDATGAKVTPSADLVNRMMPEIQLMPAHVSTTAVSFGKMPNSSDNAASIERDEIFDYMPGAVNTDFAKMEGSSHRKNEMESAFVTVACRTHRQDNPLIGGSASCSSILFDDTPHSIMNVELLVSMLQCLRQVTHFGEDDCEKMTVILSAFHFTQRRSDGDEPSISLEKPQQCFPDKDLYDAKLRFQRTVGHFQRSIVTSIHTHALSIIYTIVMPELWSAKWQSHSKYLGGNKPTHCVVYFFVYLLTMVQNHIMRRCGKWAKDRSDWVVYELFAELASTIMKDCFLQEVTKYILTLNCSETRTKQLHHDIMSIVAYMRALRYFGVSYQPSSVSQTCRSYLWKFSGSPDNGGVPLFLCGDGSDAEAHEIRSLMLLIAVMSVKTRNLEFLREWRCNLDLQTSQPSSRIVTNATCKQSEGKDTDTVDDEVTDDTFFKKVWDGTTQEVNLTVSNISKRVLRYSLFKESHFVLLSPFACITNDLTNDTKDADNMKGTSFSRILPSTIPNVKFLQSICFPRLNTRIERFFSVQLNKRGDGGSWEGRDTLCPWFDPFFSVTSPFDADECLLSDLLAVRGRKSYIAFDECVSPSSQDENVNLLTQTSNNNPSILSSINIDTNIKGQSKTGNKPLQHRWVDVDRLILQRWEMWDTYPELDEETKKIKETLMDVINATSS